MAMRVWLVLLGLTAVEVLLAYLHTPQAVMLAAVMALSVAKAVLIIQYFMHLKSEPRPLGLALFPMLILCIGLLFILVPDGIRAWALRAQ